jgi:thiamine-phosphate pyrophosphorylase
VRLPDLIVFSDEDQAHSRARGVVETVARAFSSPQPHVALVVRAKTRHVDHVRVLCAALLPIVRHAHAQLLVHTHTALVRELGLDGVHLSSTDDVNAARAVLPDGALLGASRHAGDAFHGLDYATLSPVFAPTSKPADARAPLGLDALRALCASTKTPLYALGGVTPKNARACVDAGARGVCVLGFVMGAVDPARALAALSAGRPPLTRG